jgi:hypothetical protein
MFHSVATPPASTTAGSSRGLEASNKRPGSFRKFNGERVKITVAAIRRLEE